MADDPNKRQVDGWFVSSQPHEYEYFKDSIKKEFSRKSDDEIAQAILACRRSLSPSEGREKLKQCVRNRLR